MNPSYSLRSTIPSLKALTRLMTGLLVAMTILATASATAAWADSADDLLDRVAKAHGETTWDQQAAIAADINVSFGGQQMIDGKMITDTPVGASRFELADGTLLVFDGNDAWTAPADSAFQGTRFHVLTWPYFLAAPMKLDDPGSHFEALGKLAFKDGASLDAGRLTFDGGVGDSPDDWYIAYFHDDGSLAGMAYIVTFGKDLAAAEKEPHVIVYEGYENVEGVQLSSRWSFYNWNREDGVIGEPIGSVELDNLRFVEPADDVFDRPEGARQDAAPGN